MGNKNTCSKTVENEETLTEYDLTVFKIKQEKVFWGTIAICIVFAVFALILFLASYLSDNVRYILLNRFLPFTIVYIFGTIIIVSYLVYNVYYFRPIKINRNNNFEQLSCPDYWKLEKTKLDITNTEQTSLFDTNVNPNLFTYKCVMDTDLFNKAELTKKNSLRLANYNVDNDKTTNFSDKENTNKYDKYLYTNILEPSNKTAFKNISKDNVPLHEFMKHNLIMNNYTNLKSEDNNILKFKYNIDTETKLNEANNLEISHIKQDNNLNNSQTEYIYPTEKTYLDINIDSTNKKNISSIKTKSNPDSDSTNMTTINNLPLACDRVYPLYLATKDIELSKNNSKLDQNTLRCAYSKMCGVPWTDLNCGKYEENN